MKEQLFYRKKTRMLFIICFFLFICLPSAAQQMTIKGRVVDAAQGDALIGVTIKEKGTANGTVTDLNGNYSISVSSSKSVLVYSFIGYVSQEIRADRSVIDLKMRESSKDLQEVVVVGYGTQKKVNLTGAVSQVTGDALAAKPSANVLSAMQGELPGIQILRSSGQPGSETSGIRIRGYSSTNSTAALVLVDGVESDINLLNPNDIESISVLKDAAACAIYGARAAAGVVLVTTKRGSTSGVAKVSYNGYFAINTPGNMPERVTAWKEQEMINESRIQANGKPEWNAEQSSWVGNPNFNYRPNLANGRWDYFQATNWIDEGSRDYMTQQSHSVSINGGKKELNYMISANYYTKQGILKYGPDKNNRVNLRANLNATLNTYMDANVNLSYSSTLTKTNPYGAASILERLYRVRGRQPVYVPEEDETGQVYNGDLQVNPIDLMKNGGVSDTFYRAYTGKGSLIIHDVIKGLKLQFDASRKTGVYDQSTERHTLIWKDRLNQNIRFSVNTPNSFYRQKNEDDQDLFETLLTYNLKVKDHAMMVLAGTSYENYRKTGLDATVKNLYYDELFSMNYYDSSEATNTNVSDNINTWAMSSYFGRLNYSFADKYLFEANVRYDGSSRLAKDRRWKLFPSFSAGWRVNQEKWFDIPVVSNLKLRASWGKLGNGAVLGYYDYIPMINSSSTITGDGSVVEDTYYQSSLASKDKTWEVITTSDIGFDLGLFNGKLLITGDYYWKTNDDMLATLQVPSLIGVSVPNANVGKLKTWGWEFEVGYKNHINDFNYQVSFNISDSDNKLVRYDGKSTVYEGVVTLLEGYPLNTIWGYKTDGYWSSRDEYVAYKEANPGYQSFNDAKISGGDMKYVAQGKADHTIGAGGGTPQSPGDLVKLGDCNAHYIYGFNIAAQWKGFDFNVMFQGVGKRNVLLDAGTICPLATTSDMPWTIHEDYWTADNPNAFLPRLYSANTFNYHPSDRWVMDASYLRLKNLTFGYTVPLKGKAIQKLRIYMAGEDLWEMSDMLKVFDPEVGNTATANYYPFFRTWSVGINLTF